MHILGYYLWNLTVLGLGAGLTAYTGNPLWLLLLFLIDTDTPK